MELQFMIILLIVTCLFLASITPSSSETSPGFFGSCLTASNVTNFTMANGDHSDAASSAFNRLFYYSIQNLRFTKPGFAKPVAVILPETKLQLSGAILCCRRTALRIRLRSGGHSYEGLSYITYQNTSSFVVIDMMNLNKVRVDSATNTAWVEAGATLGETYHAIAESSQNLGFPAGSFPTVGTGGHIAGGGFGLMSRKYGLAADNVIDAVLVDSNGQFLNRDSMGEDVFWAIRGGGGGCWGAIYAWRIRLVPVPDQVTVFSINRSGSTSHVAGLVNSWQHVAHDLPDEFYLGVSVSNGLPEAEAIRLSARFKGFYLGPKSDTMRIISKRFPELHLLESDCHEMSWLESVVFFSNLAHGSPVADLTGRVWHEKPYFKAKSDYVRAPINKMDLIGAFDLMATEPKSRFILDPYGGAMDRIESGELPFPHRGGNLYAILYVIEWTEDDDSKSEGYIDWLRGFYDYMAPLVSKGPRAAYMNALDLDLGTMESTNDNGRRHHDAVAEARVWGEKYFLGNFDRLVQAKTTIDPENVFQNAQSIPPFPTLGVVNDEAFLELRSY